MAATESEMLELGTIAPGFSLPDPDGVMHSLGDGKQAYLVMFICNHCPFVIHVREELAHLGRDLDGLRPHKRARLGIGRTFQRIELFSDTTVREHLLIADRVHRGTGSFWKDLVGRGRPTTDEMERCDEVLDLLGLRELGNEPIEALSLGQGRLVEVGRALMTEPHLLLLDEPSSGLDREETNALAATLQAIQAEKRFAILLVEHDVDLVADFTERLYVLDFGTLIAKGPTTETLRHPAVRKAYLGNMEAADG